MIQPAANGLVAFVVLALFTGTVHGQSVRYVDAGARSSVGDGLSWATAYAGLHEALDEASLDSSIEQIWVAEGQYTPDRGAGDRDDTFLLVSGVSLYGGFAGDEASLEDRTPGAHPTILSGDVGGDDIVTMPAGRVVGEIPPLPEFTNYEENSRHVLTGLDLADPLTIDGFTVRGGNADFDGDFQTGGGGMLIERCALTLSNCRFEFNRCGLLEPDVAGFGGAVFLRGGGLRSR